MKRIALITYDISPYRGSESSVSWNFVRKMSHSVHLTVVYGGGNDDIIRYFIENPSLDNVDWIHIPTVPTKYAGLLGHLDYMRNYRRWQQRAKEILQPMATRGEIDLIHYLNPIGFKEPGYCWQISEVPYIWGPIAAVHNRPLRLYHAYSLKGKVNAMVRRIAHNALFRFMPRLHKALRSADAVFAASGVSVELLEKVHGCRAIYLPENGIPAMERTEPIAREASEPLCMIWVGRVDDQDKGLVILLDALLKLRRSEWGVYIVGQGELTAKQRRRYAPIMERLHFTGKIPRQQVQELFLGSHLHVITSMGETNPTVIWEAMAKGVPTLTLDHCGMAATVCADCGIKIPIQSYGKTTDRIAAEIERLIAEPELTARLSAGVLRCSNQFMWDRRLPLFLSTYTRLISQHTR